MLNNSDCDSSDGIYVSSRRIPPCVVDMGTTSQSHVFDGPASENFGCEQLYDVDSTFGSPIDVGHVVLDLVDDDGVFYSPLHVGPAVHVDGNVQSFDSHVEVGPTFEVLPDEDGAFSSPIKVGPRSGECRDWWVHRGGARSRGPIDWHRFF